MIDEGIELDSILITVAVPVYNGEKTICDCINSIIKQTYKNFEVLIINDGSTDNTLQLCMDFQKKDDRIRVIDKEHSGVSDARNMAIKSASGNYICFLDADDLILPIHLEVLIEQVSEKSTLYSTTYQTVDKTKDIIYNYHGDISKKQYQLMKYDKSEAQKTMFFGKDLGNYCWDKIYNMEFIKQYNIWFDKSLQIGEDMLFVNQYLQHVDNVVLIDSRSYIHFKNNESVMEKLIYDENGWRELYHSVEASKKIREIATESKVKDAIDISIIQAEEHLLRILCAKDVRNELFEKILGEYRKSFYKAIVSKNVIKKQKFKVLLMGVLPCRRWFYKLVYRNKFG